MIRLNEARFEEIYKLMVEAFPITERRSKEAQCSLFQNPTYEVYGCIQNNEICAVLAIWNTPSAHFIEHLAVAQSLRGKGIGETLLKQYMATTKLPIILEVEKPEHTIAQRRINFYERLGFHLYENITYVQPSFHEGMIDLPLHIMVNQRLSQSKVIALIKEMYEHVYKRVYK